MAVICSICGKVHYQGAITCEQSEKLHQEFLREVEHHKMHCEGCPNPEAHVRNLKASKKRTPPIFGATI